MNALFVRSQVSYFPHFGRNFGGDARDQLHHNQYCWANSLANDHCLFESRSEWLVTESATALIITVVD